MIAYLLTQLHNMSLVVRIEQNMQTFYIWVFCFCF